MHEYKGRIKRKRLNILYVMNIIEKIQGTAVPQGPPMFGCKTSPHHDKSSAKLLYGENFLVLAKVSITIGSL